MTGIEAALQGRLARAAELRTTKTDKAMGVLSVAVDEGEGAVTWVKVPAFEAVAESVRDLEKGAELYAEGRLKLDTYEGRDGQQRTSLTVLARLVQPVGRIGRRRPRAPDEAPARAPAWRENAGYSGAPWRKEAAARPQAPGGWLDDTDAAVADLVGAQR